MTRSVEFRGQQIPITVAPAPSTEDAIGHPLLLDWIASLDNSMDLQALDLQSVDRVPSGRVGFIKFKSTTIRNGVPIPGICLLRGAAFVLLTEITDADTNESWTVLLKKPRVPTGKVMTEVIAGTVDESGDLRGLAVRKLEKSSGLVAKPEELINLTELAYGENNPWIWTAVGLCDETLKVFLWRTAMAHADVIALGERVGRDLLVKFADFWKFTSDGKGLAALAIYDGLKAEGRI
jgi:ADP-sugar diphosphatase